MSLLIPAIIGGVSAIASGLLSSSTQSSNTNKSVEANKELAKYQYEKDVEMWNAANEYNTPANQMQRLEQAGLNPNLVYGTGTVTGNTSTQTPKYQNVNADYRYTPDYQVAEGIQAFQDTRLKGAQTNNLKVQNDLIIQQATTEAIRAAKEAVGVQHGEFNLKLARKLERNTLEVADQNLRLMQQDQALKSQDLNIKLGLEELQKEQLKESRGRQDNLSLDAETKRLQNEWRRTGVVDSDPFILRMLSRLIGGDPFSDLKKQFKTFID